MKKFNQMTERHMTKTTGGLGVALAVAAGTAIAVSAGSVTTYVLNGYNNDK